ncbi:MAG: site-specific integrase [Mesoflavibacter sp.]|nr:site-specific integrase [Mesoflavibacter sp.]
MIKKNKNIFYRAIMLFLLNTGVKVSEMLALNVNDVIDSKGQPQILLKVGLKEKRGIPLNADAREQVWTLFNICKDRLKDDFYSRCPLFVSSHKKRICRSHVYRIIERIGRINGIDDFSPSLFRHHFCLTLKNQNVNFKIIQILSGHKNLQTTLEVYGFLHNHELIDAVTLIKI